MDSSEAYVRGVISSRSNPFNLDLARAVYEHLEASIMTWGHVHIHDVYPSGSTAKGTALKGVSDVDLLISVKHTAVESLKDVYEKLYNRLHIDGFNPRRQNVSVGIELGGVKVDLVPAKRQDARSNTHSLWSHKTKSWRETNVHDHVTHVVKSNRVNEIILTKLWAKLHGLEFPSFPLEVTVIKAVKGSPVGTYASNFVKVLEYIRDELPKCRLIDPTKPSNILSDELTKNEKEALSAAARMHLGMKWGEVLW